MGVVRSNWILDMCQRKSCRTCCWSRSEVWGKDRIPEWANTTEKCGEGKKSDELKTTVTVNCASSIMLGSLSTWHHWILLTTPIYNKGTEANEGKHLANHGANGGQGTGPWAVRLQNTPLNPPCDTTSIVSEVKGCPELGKGGWGGRATIKSLKRMLTDSLKSYKY